VQGILAIPVLYGFAALVFSSAAYQQFMPSIAKVFMFSSGVHALAVATFSSLPYAIGQVQDAGLLFFAKMATDTARRMHKAEPAAVTATALVTIGISTAIVGICLICVGKLKLANLVSYIPMPVFGGYLAFIGLFCVEAGLSLTSGMAINGINTWHLLLESDRTILLAVTAVFTGGCLCWVARNLDTMILPACICVVPILFYLALLVTDTSMEEARAFGWLGQQHPPGNWENVIALYDFSLVDWSVLPHQLPSLLTMTIVIVFGSTMDVAAVEMGTGVPLNPDDQLITIGVSNVLAGLSGGFAGSYIFTQSLLGFKSKFHHRSVGYVLAVLQLLVFMCSFDPLCSIPLFFFASTIIFIGIDLLLEWLWEVRVKLGAGEYVVLLITFASVVAVGMDMGFLIGILAAIMNFVYEYAVSTRDNSSRYVVNITSRMRSGHLRKPEHERRLKQYFGAIRTLELHGSIFFGSAASVFKDIVDACTMSLKLPMGPSYGSVTNFSGTTSENG
jgi:sulfate permease, SulP family